MFDFRFVALLRPAFCYIAALQPGPMVSGGAADPSTEVPKVTMLRGEQGMSAPDRNAAGDAREGDLGGTLVRVLHADGRDLFLETSPCAHSRPGFAGDHGTVDGVRVLDVLEHEYGVLHYLERPLDVRPGQVVEVLVDRDRRDRLERTHGATVVTLALLEQRGVPVVGPEIQAGMAWIEIAEPTWEIELESLAALAIPLERRPIPANRMLVTCGGIAVATTNAPICATTKAMRRRGGAPGHEGGGSRGAGGRGARRP